ncbi:MAG: adenylate/guanylate cyclase domain-containing protein [Acidobacteria bacterium]|nr:MAG: adenylate/guanylate cyclase domain-containing protein [Acidobacteriota bacterium]
MADLPLGTVTFLFTDIEGSTTLLQRSPAAMEAAHARHDALLHEAIKHNDGYVFKTMGDAFCAAFHTAPSALAAALAGQRALSQEAWPESADIKVRMGLHTGTVDVRDNDYFGQPLNRVARLVAAGHGGQILLTLATQELVRDSLPGGVILRDMGERRLKDLIHPDRIYQVIALDLPADFPPLKTLDTRSHNLPIQSTSFVGRDRELQQVKALLRSERLVSLTGSGGVGKTRLALHAGADSIDEFYDGVWLVELASLTDASLVPQAVAAVLGIREQPGTALIDTLTLQLKTKELLLVLDNCEHLIEASARLCHSLLAACGNVRVLATSREALRIPGESSYRVPSLATPDPKSNACTEAFTQYAAVRLFIDRALAVNSSFQLNNASAAAVANICHHLDGIPLAIELAAARVRSMSVNEVNQRLNQRFRFLTGGARTTLPRQQTLRSLIDWSYDLLNDGEKALLCRLSVFSGGWTLEAAEQVCVGEGVEEDRVLDLLTSLVDKNLVVAEERSGATRYRLLETVHQYGRARLREIDDEVRWQQRHFACFLSLAEEADTETRHGAHQQRWLDRLEDEHDNLRFALAFPSAEAVDRMRLAIAVGWFWEIRAYFREGRNWFDGLLPVARSGKTAVNATVLLAAGKFASVQGDYVTAQNLMKEALAIRREQGDRRAIARALVNSGQVAREQGNYEESRALYEEAMEIAREIGDFHLVCWTLLSLGYMAELEGDYASAKLLLEEAMTICRKRGDQKAIAESLKLLGDVARAQSDVATALSRYKESMTICRALGDREVIAYLLEALSALVSSRPLLAARIWGAAERLREQVGAPLSPKERFRYDRMVASARAAGDDAVFNVAWQEGRGMPLDQAVEFALKGGME